MRPSRVISNNAGAKLAGLLALAVGALFGLLLLLGPFAQHAGADPRAIATCLRPCHAIGGALGPDIETAYSSGADGAGHRIAFDPRVVTNTGSATVAQGSALMCSQCHVEHGQDSDSVFSFSQVRSGGPITTVRGLCVGCHRPFDSLQATPTVLGLSMLRLPSGVADHGGASTAPCSDCHGATGHSPEGHGGGGSGCSDPTCHGGSGSHTIHRDGTDARGPGALACSDCHDTDDYPAFAAGTDANLDGRITLDETTVCDGCHSPDGAYDGLDSTAGSVGARDHWASRVYETPTTLAAGNEKWCIGCHDDIPASVVGFPASNKAGDDSTYGYYVTGHGRQGAYGRMNWQASDASGNPGASRDCTHCHEPGEAHIGPGDNDRLIAGMANDENDSNCNACHTEGGAQSAPTWYTDYTAYEDSAHASLACTDCHDVHGMAGTFVAMTRGSKQALCYQCHNDTGVKNDAVSGAALADDIPQAFGMSSTHDLGGTFTASGKSYTLQCTSCHNVHVITGKYWEADASLTPVTRFSANTEPWGDEAGERMADYAGTGAYQTPASDTFSGNELPDYVTFCMDCHGAAMPSPPTGRGGINWSGDAHGRASANVPPGGGTPPDWYSCGKAYGWDGDDRLGPESQVWPVLPRGYGEQIFSREPFNQGRRIGGANFTLSCTDCHEAHGSGVSSMLRSNPNGGTGTWVWNTMCNNCHYYYSDWHAGMSCGSASCHVSSRMTNTGTSTLHSMGSGGGTGGTRSFDASRVAEFRFDGNLNDSGDWRLHGRWSVASGSYVSGKSGSAVQISDQPIEVGTRNTYWSTDEGRHGTWKYTEMKYEMTLEAWVYPTTLKNESIIMAKHTYWDGGYCFLLKQVDGTLRAALMTNVTGGGPTWPDWDGDDCNGLRGAYSSVPLPLNEWSHVAVTYDASGPDRDAGDPSVGRIRIWVNGNDVTWSNASTTGECYSQPGPGEDIMFPYSLHSPDNESVCYDGHWCASALSIGGVNWSSTSNFEGRIDTAKIFNTTYEDDYFSPIDASIAPKVINASGAGTTLDVVFSEGVFSQNDQTGALVPGDFVLFDAGGDNPKGITSVSHTAGASSARLTLSSPFIPADFGVDWVGFAANQVFDDEGVAGLTIGRTIAQGACPTGKVRIQLDEPAGSATATDEQAILAGVTNDPAQTFTGDGSLHGDGVNNYVDFEANPGCLIENDTMTLEYRVKPANIPNDTTTSYIRRVLARDGGGNYQSSVWRNPSWAEYNPPAGAASIALWVMPVDAHGGNTWKVALTDYAAYPIVSNHWYRVRVVWDSAKVGGIPAEIYVDDQGTDGAGTGELWAGFIDATDSDQSQIPVANRLYEGDVIATAQGPFTIGANVSNHANNVFDGLIDWVTWDPAIDRSLPSDDTPMAGLALLPAMHSLLLTTPDLPREPANASGPEAMAQAMQAATQAEASGGAQDASLKNVSEQPLTNEVAGGAGGTGRRAPRSRPAAATLGFLAIAGGLSLVRKSVLLLRALMGP